MKVENINMYLIGRFMFCVFINKIPQSFRTLFRKKQWISLLQYQICPSFTPSVKLDLNKTGIKYRGAIVWNIIAESGANLDVSETAFKKVWSNW